MDGVLRPTPSSGDHPADPASPPSPIRDLIAEASKRTLHRILGRDETLARVVGILERACHYPLLLGEVGVGRGAVVEALAQALGRGSVPAALTGARLFAIGPSASDKELEALVARGSKDLLSFEDPRALAQTARALRAVSGRDRVSLIGRASSEEYYGSLSRQHYLEGCFETVVIEPLSPATTGLVLRELRLPSNPVATSCRALSDRLAERKIALEWSDTAIQWLAGRAFPRDEGAHRLHRTSRTRSAPVSDGCSCWVSSPREATHSSRYERADSRSRRFRQTRTAPVVSPPARSNDKVRLGRGIQR